jgi:hypothetical protein
VLASDARSMEQPGNELRFHLTCAFNLPSNRPFPFELLLHLCFSASDSPHTIYTPREPSYISHTAIQSPRRPSLPCSTSHRSDPLPPLTRQKLVGRSVSSREETLRNGTRALQEHLKPIRRRTRPVTPPFHLCNPRPPVYSPLRPSSVRQQPSTPTLDTL